MWRRTRFNGPKTRGQVIRGLGCDLVIRVVALIAVASRFQDFSGPGLAAIVVVVAVIAVSVVLYTAMLAAVVFKWDESQT